MNTASKRQQTFGFSAEKMFYRIGEASRIIGVETCVLRYWESEFDVLSPRRARSGQRIYSAEDIGVLLHIKRLLYEERYTIDGAKKQLGVVLPDAGKQAATDETPSPDTCEGDVISIVQQRLRLMLERLSS
jgi:DNA-binding transcriptional MerR regulator